MVHVVVLEEREPRRVFLQFKELVLLVMGQAKLLQTPAEIVMEREEKEKIER